ncbi:flagellar biosynthesis repressor FlbT [Paracoccus sp. CPCC 101403]|uniref:Flagellar biosynthesis repressor FlbT n=2 Tax=Paracoccus broussonetiae TaxID=3075834 RepID=A0ABU3EB32_9RHOB|nr:flagellar biosynthesis repressor FlbT [Paracoccus sp. CPCC 101403]MDT1061441.1 flagellar biosynthesis repressor FlbT [Paracoccus sp. CPCC 101403]
MSGLILKLAPRERVLINGAVIENGDKRARLSVRSPNANILRLRDAIHPDEAQTPVSRVCYICQLVISGDADETQGRMQALHGVEQLSRALPDSDSRGILDTATKALIDGNYYLAMKQLRTLLPREARLLAQVQP